MARHLRPQDIPEAAKTVRVDVFDKDDVRTGTRNVRAAYFWQTPDGSRFIGQATAREKGMFKMDEEESPATIQVNKYGSDGVFLGGPWTVKDMAGASKTAPVVIRQ